MRSPSETFDLLEDFKLSAKDTADFCDVLCKKVEHIRNCAIEIERQLNVSEPNLEDSYNPITRSLRLIEEIIHETD